jgi:NAD(P)-dependent dehydrogenase (short-subunit alcohol dehydrogenase family)
MLYNLLNAVVNWSMENLFNPKLFLPGALRGRTALITGGNSGTGLCAARMLGRAGAKILLACRDAQRARQAKQRLCAQQADIDVELVQLDLANLSSVQQAAQGLLQAGQPIDLLLNNAGVMAVPQRRLSADGFELQFATNHLGHFALTLRLLPLLTQRAGCRVVCVSSLAHRGARFDPENLQGERSYGAWSAYNASKLANLLFAFELHRRLAPQGPTLSVAAHPGIAATNLMAAGPTLGGVTWRSQLLAKLSNIFSQTDEQGALPILCAAVHPAVCGGDYVGPGGLLEMRGAPKKVAASKLARNAEAAKKLWAISEELTQISWGR